MIHSQFALCRVQRLALLLAALPLIATPPPAVRAQIIGPGVYAWGDNQYGQLGTGNNSNSTSNLAPAPVTALSGVAVTAVAGGGDHSLALTKSGAVYTWGANYYGQLGSGTTTGSLTPVPVTGLSGVNVTAVAGGGNHSLALTSTGAVYAWGNNFYGQLGNGTFNTYSAQGVPTPAPVTGLSGVNVTAVAAGAFHSLALSSTGAVYAWGDDGNGQLGDGIFNVNSSTPVLVTGLPGVTVTAVAAGFNHSLALTSTGAVYAWGDNHNGEFGNGTIAGSLTPVPVTSMSGVDVKAIAAGVYFSLALSSTGAVYAWGYNYDGELGNGTTTNALSALLVPLPANGSATVVAIAAGNQDSFALESDGSLWAWGDNFYGQYGNGTETSSLTPIEVYTPTGGYGISTFAEGEIGYHSLAIVTPIPEPGSLGLVVAAAGLVGAWRLRRAMRAACQA